MTPPESIVAVDVVDIVVVVFVVVVAAVAMFFIIFFLTLCSVLPSMFCFPRCVAGLRTYQNYKSHKTVL